MHVIDILVTTMVLVLSLILPPQHHLLFGVVNHMLRQLQIQWTSSEVEVWLSKCNISRTAYRNQDLNGNSCRLVIRPSSIRFLESMLPLTLSKLFIAFEALNSVVETCFGFKFLPSYKTKIEQFRESYNLKYQ